ncbi:MAG: (Fe-S)-binding protein [Deltaproteobacteria bacterium]|nr:(Fe-S)-binding protein [Deltaproteobacteria bacterium]
MAEVNKKAIKEALNNRLTARIKTYLSICAHCGLCADTCHFYVSSDGDPKQVPSYKVKPLLNLIKRKGDVDEDFLKEMYEIVYGSCSMCRRCSLYCPFGIDIASMIAFSRTIMVGQGMIPEALADACKNIRETGNQMAVSEEDWVETVKWMEEELQDELPGATIPIDKKGAKIMYTVNAREPKFYPMDIQLAAKIFYLAGEDWTVPSKTGWDSTNLAMFAGDIPTASHAVNLIKQQAIELGVKQVAITECGHAFRSLKWESPVWLGEPHPFEVVHSVQLFADYIRSGRIKIKEQGFTEPITYQDPCNVSRNGGLAGDARYLMRTLCSDFRDMMANGNGNYNFCCGGGGGFIPMAGPFRKRRIDSGRTKAEQIRKTGAKVVLTPCHNCFDQVRDLCKEYELGCRNIQFKELIDELLIIPEELKAEE